MFRAELTYGAGLDEAISEAADNEDDDDNECKFKIEDTLLAGSKRAISSMMTCKRLMMFL